MASSQHSARDMSLANRNPARYLELVDEITSDIRNGTYPVGGSLPTEAQFCEQYDVSRFTIREALRRIEAAGLITKQQGRGSRVISARPPASFIMIGQSEEDVLRYAAGTCVEFRKAPGKVSAPTARKFRLGNPEDWMAFTGVRRIPDTVQPIAVLSVYLRAEYAGVLDDLEQPLSSALFLHVVEYGGLHLTQIEQLISAVNM